MTMSPSPSQLGKVRPDRVEALDEVGDRGIQLESSETYKDK